MFSSKQDCPHCGQTLASQKELESHVETCEERIADLKDRLNLNPKWEYKVIQKDKDKWDDSISSDQIGLSSELDDELNKYGDEGWELINVVPVQGLQVGAALSSRGTTTVLLYVFKRKKAEVRNDG